MQPWLCKCVDICKSWLHCLLLPVRCSLPASPNAPLTPLVVGSALSLLLLLFLLLVFFLLCSTSCWPRKWKSWLQVITWEGGRFQILTYEWFHIFNYMEGFQLLPFQVGSVQNPEAAPSLNTGVRRERGRLPTSALQVGSVQNPEAAPSLNTGVRRERGRLPTSALTSWKCP